MLLPVVRCSRVIPEYFRHVSFCLAYIVAHRCKDLDQSFAAGLLEIERVDLSFAIGSFEFRLTGKGKVTPEFFRPL
jgi:hypothetical protein